MMSLFLFFLSSSFLIIFFQPTFFPTRPLILLVPSSIF